MRSGVLILCWLQAGACSDGDAAESTWTLVGEAQPAALLSVWGSDVDDVWVVGGREAPGGAPIARHFDGVSWSSVDTGVTGVDLWWVFGFENGPVFFGGSGGTILRLQDGELERFATPGTSKVFGMWGAAPDDVWAVGGDGGAAGFAWHFDGEAWTAADVPSDLATEGTVFKVSGRASDDVYMPCSGGTMLRTDGGVFDREELDADVLFSVAVTDDAVITVGEARSEGAVFEHDGAGWTTATGLEGAPAWRGVAAVGDHAVAVGELGAIALRSNGRWTYESTDLTTQDLHGAWIDPSGGIWVVGGAFDQPVTEDGVLLHRGAVAPAAF